MSARRPCTFDTATTAVSRTLPFPLRRDQLIQFVIGRHTMESPNEIHPMAVGFMVNAECHGENEGGRLQEPACTGCLHGSRDYLDFAPLIVALEERRAASQPSRSISVLQANGRPGKSIVYSLPFWLTR